MLNYAIIGCGRIFRCHAVSVERHPDARLAAVADIKPEALEAARAEFPGVDTYTDYNEMLERPDIDAVSICLPHHLHAPATIACARAKKHVLCEKPIALDRTEANEMIKACRENGVKLGIVLQNRYNDATKKMLRAIEQKRFGKMITGSLLLAAYRPPSYYQDEWHGRWATEGGGSLLTQAIHNVDLPA